MCFEPRPAGVIDENIDAAEQVLGLLGNLGGGRVAGQIARHHGGGTAAILDNAGDRLGPGAVTSVPNRRDP